jgi:CBS domain-containing protein
LITQQAQPVRHLARTAPILSAEDTLGHAAEVMRSHHLGALAVSAEGRVIGLIREDDLLQPLSESPEGARLLRVGEFAVGDPVTVPGSATPTQALRALQWSGSAALPVIEEDGFYQGMISRSDLLEYWAGDLKPSRIGGMATPFGVYLTGAGLRGGVSDTALYLTGAMMGLLVIGLQLALPFLFGAVQNATGWPVAALADSPAAGLGNWMDVAGIFVRALPYLFFIVLIRLTPVAGYHAGEHQTVWAIERGEPLVPEVVARMPRPHPRCGTNLVTGMIIFDVVRNVDPYWGPYLAMIAALLFWRRLGHYVQLYFTTRPATPKQLESGIKAGKELLEKYRQNPGGPAVEPLVVRLWNLGLLKILLGYGAVTILLSLIFGSAVPLF